jgi:hypothetical protein
MIKIRFLLVILLSLSFVSAVGVGSIYSRDSPLSLYPGQSETVFLSLQNADVVEGITLNGVITEGGNIAVLDREKFPIPFKSTDVFARLTVRIPKNATIGSSYSISYEFSEAPSDGGSTVTVSKKIKRGFNVLVIDKPEQIVETPSQNKAIVFLIILLIIAIVAIIFLLIRNRTSM